VEQICLKGGLSNPPKMNLLPLGCVLLLLASAQAEDIMFFADDHYKSLGRPALAASSANPALLAGEGVLHINLANLGRLEELMLINQSGPAQDIRLEMKEEMKGSHALAIDVALIGSGPILVTSGPERIDDIAPGEKAMLDYNVSVMKNASGWSKLALDVSYQRQADVSVNNGEVYPLYEAARDNLSVDVFVAGKGESLSILGSALSHNLFRGQRLRAAISNDGPEDLHNCSARLLAAPPFSASGPERALGDLPAGSLALADFDLKIDGDAKQQDYQMGCQICCQQRCTSLPLTISLRPGRLDGWMLPALAALGLAGLMALLLKRTYLLSRDKRRRRN
jgi:hypothetical protein